MFSLVPYIAQDPTNKRGTAKVGMYIFVYSIFKFSTFKPSKSSEGIVHYLVK